MFPVDMQLYWCEGASPPSITLCGNIVVCVCARVCTSLHTFLFTYKHPWSSESWSEFGEQRFGWGTFGWEPHEGFLWRRSEGDSQVPCPPS